MDYKNILNAIGETFVPEGGPFEHGGGTAGIVERFEFFVSAFGRKPFLTKIFLHLFNVLPIILFYKPFPFTSLSHSERGKFLKRLSESRISLLRYTYLLLRSIVFITFYSMEKVCAAIGYRTECEGDEGNQTKV